MSDNTGISWTDATWNPTTGCDQVSPGCDNCYALTLAKRLKAMGSAAYQVDGDPATSGPGFALTVHPDRLEQPLQWKKPRRIFVNSMSDLFHDRVTDAFIAQVFAVMALAPQHTFQVLTKRHSRLRSLLNRETFRDDVTGAILDRAAGEVPTHLAPLELRERWWPLRNVWVGVSAEDQKWANTRIPALLATPAAVRFLSMEPLLGPVDLEFIRYYDAKCHGCSGLVSPAHIPECGMEPGLSWGIDWVIVGGESGAGARPMSLQWARDIREQCRSSCTAFFLKQTGSVLAADLGLRHRAGANPSEWPEPFPQDFPTGAAS